MHGAGIEGRMSATTVATAFSRTSVFSWHKYFCVEHSMQKSIKGEGGTFDRLGNSLKNWNVASVWRASTMIDTSGSLLDNAEEKVTKNRS